MVLNSKIRNFFKNRKCLVLGSSGFIGSNITNTLVSLGADVTATYFSQNQRNASVVKFVKLDLQNPKDLRILRDHSVIFHLAGLSGLVESNKFPIQSLEVNSRAMLLILEELKENNPKAVVFYPSSQQVYGVANSLPIKEDHPTEPRNIYGIHKLTVEKYLQTYSQLFALRSVSLRLPNPYGPSQRGDRSYGIVGKFASLAKFGKEIQVFGEGSQKRDFIFIDDVVKAILDVTASQVCYGKVFNLGSTKPTKIADLARTVVETVGSGKVSFVPWTEEAKKAEIGDTYLSYDKIANAVGWKPEISLKDGIKLSIG